MPRGAEAASSTLGLLPAASPSQCVVQRRGASVGYWGNLAITAVVTGFSGSLTTVSTFITEVRQADRQTRRGGSSAVLARTPRRC